MEYQPNTEGVFEGLPAEIYHKAPGLSNSMLKHMEPTPSHLVSYLTEPFEPGPALILGSLAHTLILEPDHGLPEISINPEGLRKNSNAYKAWKEEQGTKLCIGQDAFDSLLGMTKAVSQHPYAAKALSNGRSELSLFCRAPWTDNVLDKSGEVATVITYDGPPLLRKCRIDFTPNANFLCDVKTTADWADKDSFSRTMQNFGYHRQAAWYLDIWNDLHPQDQREGFLFIVVEKSPPYGVACYFVDPQAIQIGRTINRRKAELYSSCVESGLWPCYSKTFDEVTLPDWANRQGGLL